MIQRPFSVGLNRAIDEIVARVLPQGFDVDEKSTYLDVVGYWKRTGRIAVSDLYCDSNIFGSVEMNVKFRAWHDWTHVCWGNDFTLVGEINTCVQQEKMLDSLKGRTRVQKQLWARLLWEEIVGQAEYFEQHRDFPSNQRAFAKAYLKNPFNTIRRKW